MLKFIDDFLNKITMYRLVLYYLCVLVVAALVFGLFGLLPYSPVNLLFSLVVILAVGWVVNTLFAKMFDAATSIESVYITALILALIISPVAPTNYAGIGFLVFASAWAMASKYIFAVDKKHFFNPAAFGVARGGDGPPAAPDRLQRRRPAQIAAAEDQQARLAAGRRSRGGVGHRSTQADRTWGGAYGRASFSSASARRWFQAETQGTRVRSARSA